MVYQFLIKLNTDLPYNLAIPLLDIYPSEMKQKLNGSFQFLLWDIESLKEHCFQVFSKKGAEQTASSPIYLSPSEY